MADILIVDDERVMREWLKALLVSEGYAVRMARDGVEAKRKFSEQTPDLVLLDVMMPRQNGFVACTELRKLDKLVPIIFLTAKDSDIDQVRGLEIGADDYISKAAPEAVILARIKRALKRSDAYDSNDSELFIAGVRIDLAAQTVEIDGREAHLTKTESGILWLLASSRGSYLTKNEIVDGLRGLGYPCEDGMVYTHVHNIRSKLGFASDFIVNNRTLGYKLEK